ncbi:hypothetical protein LTR95_007148 [Oleoguttula sp. CCFEE 5521]
MEAHYTSPSSSHTFTHPLPASPSSSATTADKTAHLAALREKTAQLQSEVNVFLTQKMEEDVQNATQEGKVKKSQAEERAEEMLRYCDLGGISLEVLWEDLKRLQAHPFRNYHQAASCELAMSHEIHRTRRSKHTVFVLRITGVSLYSINDISCSLAHSSAKRRDIEVRLPLLLEVFEHLQHASTQALRFYVELDSPWVSAYRDDPASIITKCGATITDLYGQQLGLASPGDGSEGREDGI